MLSSATAAASSSPSRRPAALYMSMMASSIPLDEQTFLSMLKSERRSVGKQVHAHVVLLLAVMRGCYLQLHVVMASMSKLVVED